MLRITLVLYVTTRFTRNVIDALRPLREATNSDPIKEFRIFLGSQGDWRIVKKLC